MEFITAIIGLIALIVFFVMALALSNISRAVQNTNRIISAWSYETGIGFVFHCTICKKSFTGKPPVCPHCGDPKDYTPKMNKTK